MALHDAIHMGSQVLGCARCVERCVEVDWSHVGGLTLQKLKVVGVDESTELLQRLLQGQNAALESPELLVRWLAQRARHAAHLVKGVVKVWVLSTIHEDFSARRIGGDWREHCLVLRVLDVS